MGWLWIRQVLYKRRTVLVMICVLFLGFDLYSHHEAQLYLKKVTYGLFRRRARHLKDGIDSHLLSDSYSGGVISTILQMYKSSTRTAKSFAAVMMPSDSSPWLSCTGTVDVIPGLDSMDRVLNLPPGPTFEPEGKNEVHLSDIQRRDYNFIISHNDTCSKVTDRQSIKKSRTFDVKNDVFLLMAIKSKCRSADRREAVRKTWGNETWCWQNFEVRMKLAFLLGACETHDDQMAVLKEDDRESDLLQWNFFDSFRNLTLKECLYLQWFSNNCKQVPFIFKGDDDILVNVGNVASFLKKLPADKVKDLFVGSRLHGSPRISDPKSKYYVSSKLFPDKCYPPYLSGGGFLLSGQLAVQFFVESLRTRLIPIDDAFLGILAKSLSVNPTNDRTFKSWGLRTMDDCRLAKIKTFHRALPDTLVKLWNRMINVNLTQCSKESDDVINYYN